MTAAICAAQISGVKWNLFPAAKRPPAASAGGIGILWRKPFPSIFCKCRWRGSDSFFLHGGFHVGNHTNAFTGHGFDPVYSFARVIRPLHAKRGFNAVGQFLLTARKLIRLCRINCGLQHNGSELPDRRRGWRSGGVSRRRQHERRRPRAVTDM